ncbi:wnt-activated inhibitory factor 2 [Brienomyrus brachyistius]|uniref:wnt-activated inhibitory factor 2 n=1 Tax=Brienomyrus brachyistius TaxID=42636 RepID=UPI0020B1F5D3|nr:wnt-activated inhibitory factor 2 [Brienomyrus brachyistius]
MGMMKTWDDYHGNDRAFRICKLAMRWATTTCVLLSLTKAERCPAGCTCAESTRTVTCRGLQEGDLPMDFPHWVTNLIVKGNNISILVSEVFSPYGTRLELLNLSLSENNIQIVEGGAFLGLAHLQRLDLSGNRLFSISVRAFSGLQELRYLCLNNSLTSLAVAQVSGALTTGTLRRLQWLELSGNRLKTVPLNTLDKLNLQVLDLTNNSIQTIGKENVSRLSEHKAIRVFLASNPFDCNCDLQSLHFWLQNASQCPDASLLRCSEPEGRRGRPLEKLHREDLDCTSADLEAVSYVFLGIVLALIGVVFLMVLYLNREGIKKWLNNIREACRDQMEVYHYRYEQDCDPRLANVAV